MSRLGGSYEICPSCGFQFGVSDDDLGSTYEQNEVASGAMAGATLGIGIGAVIGIGAEVVVYYYETHQS